MIGARNSCLELDRQEAQARGWKIFYLDPFRKGNGHRISEDDKRELLDSGADELVNDGEPRCVDQSSARLFAEDVSGKHPTFLWVATFLDPRPGSEASMLVEVFDSGKSIYTLSVCVSGEENLGELSRLIINRLGSLGAHLIRTGICEFSPFVRAEIAT